MHQLNGDVGEIVARLNNRVHHISVHEIEVLCLGEDVWIIFRVREQLFVADGGQQAVSKHSGQ